MISIRVRIYKCLPKCARNWRALLDTSYFQNAHGQLERCLDDQVVVALELDGGELGPADVSDGVEDLQEERAPRAGGAGGD